MKPTKRFKNPFGIEDVDKSLGGGFSNERPFSIGESSVGNTSQRSSLSLAGDDFGMENIPLEPRGSSEYKKQVRMFANQNEPSRDQRASGPFENVSPATKPSGYSRISAPFQVNESSSLSRKESNNSEPYDPENEPPLLEGKTTCKKEFQQLEGRNFGWDSTELGVFNVENESFLFNFSLNGTNEAVETHLKQSR